MELTYQVIKDIHKAIYILAEEYHQTKQYDEEGHPFDMRWEDCVNHAIDDFRGDVKGYMECQGYELSDSDADQISDYAWDNVNVSSIRKYC